MNENDRIALHRDLLTKYGLVCEQYCNLLLQVWGMAGKNTPCFCYNNGDDEQANNLVYVYLDGKNHFLRIDDIIEMVRLAMPFEAFTKWKELNEKQHVPLQDFYLWWKENATHNEESN